MFILPIKMIFSGVIVQWVRGESQGLTSLNEKAHLWGVWREWVMHVKDGEKVVFIISSYCLTGSFPPKANYLWI